MLTIKEALSAVKTEARPEKAKGGSVAIQTLTIDKEGNFVLKGKAALLMRRASYTKDGVQVQSDSIQLLKLGRGNFGINVNNAIVDGTPVRVNMSLRVNLSSNQASADSDIVANK